MNIKRGDHLFYIQGNTHPIDATVLSRVDNALFISWDIDGVEYYGVCEIDNIRLFVGEVGQGSWIEVDETNVRVSFSVNPDNTETGVHA